MPSIRQLREILAGTHSRGSRSSALHSLQWLIGLTLTGAVFAAVFDADQWVLIVLLAGLGSSLLLFFFAFLWLLFKDPDALRSESYALEKYAIERGLIGDSLSGTFESGDAEEQQLLSPSNASDLDEES